MAVIAQDSFTDTDGVTLQTHTGAGGLTWTRHTTRTSNMQIASNAAHGIGSASATQVIYHASVAPPNANHHVEAVYSPKTVNAGGSGLAGVAGRVNVTEYTAYILYFTNQDNTIRLAKHVNSTTRTILATSAAVGTGGGTLRLEMNGTSLKGYHNGVEVVSATDSDIAATGTAGVFCAGYNSSTTGVHLDSWLLDDNIAAPPPADGDIYITFGN